MARVTTTLDQDVADALRQLAHERHQPFEQVVNETLRRGLERRDAPRRRQYTQAHDLGMPRIDLTHALRIAFELEDEETIRKLEQER